MARRATQARQTRHNLQTETYCYTVIPRAGYVYILASRRNGTLYIGVTSALKQRVWRHRQGTGSGFTARYGVTRLVYYEGYDDIQTAIEREKQLKAWRRAWKIELIETNNPTWGDLYTEI